MRLLFINRFFHPDQSATARLLTDLTTGLVGQGVEVTVLTGRVEYLGERPLLPSEDFCKGVRVRRVWSTGFGRQSALGRLADYLTFYLAVTWRAARLKQVDCLVVMSDPPLLSVLAAFLGRLKGWRTVCWLQDVFPDIAVRAAVLKEGRLAGILRRVAHRSLMVSHRVIVVGRCMKRHLLQMGIPGERIVMIPNWADGEHLIPVAPEQSWFRENHNLCGRIVVMYSGNLGVVHETESLVQVICHLRANPDVCVLFVGEGQGSDRLKAWALQARMDHVRFVGYQAHEQLRSSLSAADIHLVTLRADMEGLSVPSKLYGIMAVGRPVVFIGPKGSEVAAVVEEAGCGLVLGPAESAKAALAILDLARDHERRELLGAAGRQYFESSLDKKFAIRRFQAVLEAVVN